MDNKTLHVENFPPQLIRQAKAAAALEGCTLRELIIRLLQNVATKKGGDRK
jgi:hypothetical protein